MDGRLYEGLWTDLEPAGARTVFPCIDQPEFKATFKVSDGASPRAIVKRKRKRKAWFSCNEIRNFAIELDTRMQMWTKSRLIMNASFGRPFYFFLPNLYTVHRFQTLNDYSIIFLR